MKRLTSLIALTIAVIPNAVLANQKPSHEEQWSLAQQVKRCFRLPLNESGEAVIQFRLLEGGKVGDVELVKTGSLTNYVIGLAGMRAVKTCQPYKTSITGKIRVPFIFKATKPATSAPR
ncbi:hypothetical protein [Ochrobactrum sp. EDr1-4]|uniref:hypothetical protein n=1 Tax=Ochrobactrum sp. EDr1-4 TaxID=3368622 RepID=UPI003BA242D9